MNPVLWRELRTSARRPQVMWFITGGLWLCLSIVWVVADEVGQLVSGMSGAGGAGRVLVGVLVVTLATLVALVAPLAGARALLIEQRRKTIDVLLVTPLSARDILRGKLLGALMPLFVILGATLPLALLLRLYGGFSTLQVIFAYIFLFQEALVFGLLGVGAAVLSGDRRRLGAVGLFLALAFVLAGTPLLDSVLAEGVGWWLKLPVVLAVLFWLLGNTAGRLTRHRSDLDGGSGEVRHALIFLGCGVLLCVGLGWDISNGGPTLRYCNPVLAAASLADLPMYFEPAAANFAVTLVLYLLLPGAAFPMLATRLQTYFNTTVPYERGIFF